jgi:predicted  nucleic acid-binding Zn-ribbon protein
LTNIIDKYESFFATAEKAYNEIVKNYESAIKKLHTAQEKLTNTEQKWAKEKSTLDDDLKQMKTNYHQSRTDKSELDAEIK